jgi:hypothetical protein
VSEYSSSCIEMRADEVLISARAEMPGRHARWSLSCARALTACLHRRRCNPAERCLARTSLELITERRGLPAQLSCRVPEGAAASGARAGARSRRPATCRPGCGPDSEHATEYPGASAPFLLLLLHDFPARGRSHRFPGSSPSDTVKTPMIGCFRACGNVARPGFEPWRVHRRSCSSLPGLLFLRC